MEAKYNNPSYKAFNMKDGLQFDHSNSEFPTKVYAWNYDGKLPIHVGSSKSTCYVFVYERTEMIREMNPQNNKNMRHYGQLQTLALEAGQYVCSSGTVSLRGGKGVIIEKLGHSAPFVCGGPLEEIGRLNYIDGCTDSLLIPPVMKGDSCFNHLHFPKNINQTAHTHPSLRTGLIVKGSGFCITPWGEIPLNEGDVFCILPDQKDNMGELKEASYDGITAIIGTHSFRTEDSTMDVVAFHPDSDFGAEHEEHPMINRTMIGGESAKNMEDIRSNVHE